MSHISVLAVGIALVWSVPADAAPANKSQPEGSRSYLCVAKHSTGFKFDPERREWEPAIFKGDTKHLLKRASRKWRWSDFGEDYAMDCHAPDAQGFIECSDPFTNVIMNEKTLRYTLVARHGYVQFPMTKLDSSSKVQEGSQAPYMAIGVCERVDAD